MVLIVLHRDLQIGVFESAPGNLAIMRERYYDGGMNQIVVGSRVPSPDDGITFMNFNPQRGTLSYQRAVGGIEMPTYQTWDSQKRILYSVSDRKSTRLNSSH